MLELLSALNVCSYYYYFVSFLRIRYLQIILLFLLVKNLLQNQTFILSNAGNFKDM